MKIINYKLFCLSMFFLLLYSCAKSDIVQIENLKKGTLKKTIKLEVVKIKRFRLDDETAPAPQYIQLFKDSTGKNYLSFLNKYNKAIYFYDYNSSAFIKKITYNNKEKDSILFPMGYHIKNMDSIYVYNFIPAEVKITNSKGNIFKTISLQGKENSKKWFAKYPQYIPTTVTPFIETKKELLFTGQYMSTIPEDIIDRFKFTARINFETNNVSFSSTYPKELYGSNYNWEGEIFTTVFSTLHPDGDKLIYSFPISHNLRIANLADGTYREVYAGSNDVASINSLDKEAKSLSRKKTISQIIEQNEYASILYDKYRKVYYRFLLKGISDVSPEASFKDKPIAVIVLDKNFNYLGETTLGLWKDWNWRNSFVTQEGLNIEYLDKDDIDETTMNFKILRIKKV